MNQCQQCGRTFASHNPNPKFCSRSCKDDSLRHSVDEEAIIPLYESGLTQKEIATSLGTSQKVIYSRLKAMGFKCRVAAKREQRGDRNDAWRGNEATYAAMHKRVEAVRGKPSQCELCGVAGVECEWANQSGNYADVNDYKRLCLPCHRKLDAFRRAACGRSTSGHVPRKRREVTDACK